MTISLRRGSMVSATVELSGRTILGSNSCSSVVMPVSRLAFAHSHQQVVRCRIVGSLTCGRPTHGCAAGPQSKLLLPA